MTWIDAAQHKYDISTHWLTPDMRGKEYLKAQANKVYNGYELVSTGLDKIAELICNSFWSPTYFLGGYRRKENFSHMNLCVLDYEHPDATLEGMINTLSDRPHIIGTTISHQKEKNGLVTHCLRVIVPFSQTITRKEDYYATMKKLRTESLFAENIDESCVDPARYFNPCVDIRSINLEGYPVEVLTGTPEDDPEYFGIQFKKKLHKHGMVSHWAARQLRHGFDRGDKKNTTCYGVAKDLFLAGRDHNEIFELIKNSKTYGGKISPDLAQEIKSCIKSAFNSYCRMGFKDV